MSICALVLQFFATHLSKFNPILLMENTTLSLSIVCVFFYFLYTSFAHVSSLLRCFLSASLLFCTLIRTITYHCHCSAVAAGVQQHKQYGLEEEQRNRLIKTFVQNTYDYHLNEIYAAVKNEYTDWDKSIVHPINTR